MKRNAILTAVSLGLVMGLVAPACGGSGDATGDGDGDGALGDGDAGDGDGDFAGDGDGDSAGGDGDGDAGDGDSGDGDGGSGDGDMGGMGGGVNYPDTTFTYDPSLDVEPETCASETVVAEPTPLDMYVVLDWTGSMSGSGDCPLNLGEAVTENTKWCRAQLALAEYFTSQAAAGNRAALQYMTAGPLLSNQGICPPGADNPHSQAAVELTDLPDATDGPLVQSLIDSGPVSGRGTQIESALNGIADFTLANQTAGRQMIGILITDGDPSSGGNNCTGNINTLASIASTHYDDTGIETFIIGMTGATASNLEAIAESAGGPEHDDQYCEGTDPCHYWTVGDGDPTAFVAALEAIQNAVVGCEFEVPTTDQGIANLDLVDVRFQENAASSPVNLGRAANAMSCAANEYYTVTSGEVTTINLCPTTCDLVNEESVVDIEIPCEGS